LGKSSSRLNATSTPPLRSERSRQKSYKQRQRPLLKSRASCGTLTSNIISPPLVLLSPDQIRRYKELRGYNAVAGTPDSPGGPHNAMGGMMHQHTMQSMHGN